MDMKPIQQYTKIKLGSSAELSRRTAIDQPTLSRVFNGLQMPTTRQCLMIEAVLGKSFAEISKLMETFE